MTAPFDRWRASCQPGLLPSREKLDALQPGEIVGVRADVLRQLVVQAANHDAPCRCLSGAESDEPTTSRDVLGSGNLPSGRNALRAHRAFWGGT